MKVAELLTKLLEHSPTAEVFVVPKDDTGVEAVDGDVLVALVFDDNFDIVEVI